MKSKGVCNSCKKTMAGNAMKRHLQSCAERTKANQLESGLEKLFFIKASAGPFWVYFEINASSPLKKVDSFLRVLWLDCCGHLSAFTIKGITYSIQPDPEFKDKSMNFALEKVIRPTLKFRHEYDFGTTTELELECVSERIGNVLDKITVLARNNLPDFRCKCGKSAKEICSECLCCEDEWLFCEDCAKEHECGEDVLLPVVNSPRAGLCGYTG